jgi:carbon monoxide dehydrogenase subunit G
MQDSGPGCGGFEALGQDRSAARLEIPGGAMATTFDVQLQLTGKRPPRSYLVTVQAHGPSGDVRGECAVTLAPAGPLTRLQYDANLQLGGLLALAGDGLLAGAGEHLIAGFFERLEQVARNGSTLTATD